MKRLYLRKNYSLAFYLGVLPREDELVTSSTPGLEVLRVMPLAIEQLIVNAVGEVDEKLVARSAREAGWMPKSIQPESRRYHGEVTSSQFGFALSTRGDYLRGHGQLIDVVVVVARRGGGLCTRVVGEIFCRADTVRDDYGVADVEGNIVPGAHKVLKRALVSLAYVMAEHQGQILLWQLVQ